MVDVSERDDLLVEIQERASLEALAAEPRLLSAKDRETLDPTYVTAHDEFAR